VCRFGEDEDARTEIDFLKKIDTKVSVFVLCCVVCIWDKFYGTRKYQQIRENGLCFLFYLFIEVKQKQVG
jgi:hypothetical protein